MGALSRVRRLLSFQKEAAMSETGRIQQEMKKIEAELESSKTSLSKILQVISKFQTLKEQEEQKKNQYIEVIESIDFLLPVAIEQGNDPLGNEMVATKHSMQDKISLLNTTISSHENTLATLREQENVLQQGISQKMQAFEHLRLQKETAEHFSMANEELKKLGGENIALPSADMEQISQQVKKELYFQQDQNDQIMKNRKPVESNMGLSKSQQEYLELKEKLLKEKEEKANAK